MSDQSLKIVLQLKAILQKDVTDHFSHGNLTLKGMDAVQRYAQEKLDLYIGALKKESKELDSLWRNGHPFFVKVHMSLETRSYALEILAKDSPPRK
ncbi:MAG TPA: hypothetical protein VHE12_06920 [bacterium]|nr:hypothetical protein [bacterium]